MPEFMNITLYSGQQDSFYIYLSDDGGPQDFTNWTFDAGVYQHAGEVALSPLTVNKNVAPDDDMSTAGWVQVVCPADTSIPANIYRGFWVLRKTVGGVTEIVKMGTVEIQIII